MCASFISCTYTQNMAWNFKTLLHNQYVHNFNLVITWINFIFVNTVKLNYAWWHKWHLNFYTYLMILYIKDFCTKLIKYKAQENRIFLYNKLLTILKRIFFFYLQHIFQGLLSFRLLSAKFGYFELCASQHITSLGAVPHSTWNFYQTITEQQNKEEQPPCVTSSYTNYLYFISEIEWIIKHFILNIKSNLHETSIFNYSIIRYKM